VNIRPEIIETAPLEIAMKDWSIIAFGTILTFRALAAHIQNLPDTSNHPQWEKIMKVAALGLCIVALMLGACRRETPDYTPMKLGGTSTADHAAPHLWSFLFALRI
jgi:hypothetical protein